MRSGGPSTTSLQSLSISSPESPPLSASAYACWRTARQSRFSGVSSGSWSIECIAAPRLDLKLDGEAGAAGRRDHFRADKFRLDGAAGRVCRAGGVVGDAAAFAGDGGRRVDGLVFRIDIVHRTLQDDVHCARRGAEDRLPAYGGAAVGKAGVAWKRELRAGSVGGGKRFVVEAEANVAGRQGVRRSGVLIGRHVGSF